MNEAYNSGVKVAQGYKDSKNPGDTWVSGCQAIYFCFWNKQYKTINSSNASMCITGTGDMISAEVIRKIGFHTETITEDIEFSCQCAINGFDMEYIKEAVFYEEHPTKLSVTWRQYRRWFSGSLQCGEKYGKELFKMYSDEGKKNIFPVYATTKYSDFMLITLLSIIIFVCIASYITASLGFKIIYTLILLVLLDCIVNSIVAIGLVKKGRVDIKNIKVISILLYWFYSLLFIICGAVSRIKPTKKWKKIERVNLHINE